MCELKPLGAGLSTELEAAEVEKDALVTLVRYQPFAWAGRQCLTLWPVSSNLTCFLSYCCMSSICNISFVTPVVLFLKTTNLLSNNHSR